MSHNEALSKLATAFTNAFLEFVKTDIRVIRLAPISGGIFAGIQLENMPDLTREAPPPQLAYATLAMLATDSLVVAGILGSMAAACECELDGNIPITPENVLAKIDAVEQLTSYSD